MKRLWYLDLQKRDDALKIRVSNVFDGFEPAEPLETEVPDLADAEAILRAVKPFTHISRRYMETNGLGSLLRIASLPKMPLEELVGHALALAHLEALPASVLVTPFLTRDEIGWYLRQRRIS